MGIFDLILTREWRCTVVRALWERRDRIAIEACFAFACYFNAKRRRVCTYIYDVKYTCAYIGNNKKKNTRAQPQTQPPTTASIETQTKGRGGGITHTHNAQHVPSRVPRGISPGDTGPERERRQREREPPPPLIAQTSPAIFTILAIRAITARMGARLNTISKQQTSDTSPGEGGHEALKNSTDFRSSGRCTRRRRCTPSGGWWEQTKTTNRKVRRHGLRRDGPASSQASGGAAAAAAANVAS